jgi:hypothetical protein
MKQTPTEARLAEILAAVSRADRETLQDLEFDWPGTLDFLTRLTGHVGCLNRPAETVANMTTALKGGLDAYRGAARGADRARFKAFVEGLRRPLGEGAEGGLVDAALDGRQRAIVQTEAPALDRIDPEPSARGDKGA